VNHGTLRTFEVKVMPTQVKKDRSRPNKKKDIKQTTTPSAEVIDWFLAIDMVHV
jgi:hypothetical protein